MHAPSPKARQGHEQIDEAQGQGPGAARGRGQGRRGRGRGRKGSHLPLKPAPQAVDVLATTAPNMQPVVAQNQRPEGGDGEDAISEHASRLSHLLEDLTNLQQQIDSCVLKVRLCCAE